MKKLTFFLLLLATFYSLYAKENPKRFSLVISGGISLGAYEAGYNWALLKYMTYLKHYSPTTEISMYSIAGASAGAINTLMSALAWCRSKEALDINNTIDDNLFYHMWTEVDFEDLLIDQRTLIDRNNTTSLFSRKKIAFQAEKILEELHRPLYDPTCRIPFGFAVTRVEPKLVKIHGIEINNKLFQIPMFFQADEAHRGVIKDNDQIQNNNIIHLSQAQSISDQALKKAMFASSAFPIAFEQVELKYFYKGEQERAKFLDGGVFDNVPLDLAIRLAHNQSSDYIFMDPKNLRKTFVFLDEKEKQARPISPLNSAIALLMDIFSTSESSVLYSTLSEHFGNSDKEIHLSNRYFPITGMLLEHFGAFLDYGFRKYDYYIGVYDAIVNSASYACREKDSGCFERSKRIIYKIVAKDSLQAKGFLNFLAKEEFATPFEEGSFPLDPQLKKIYRSLKHVSQNDMQDFHLFIKKLKKSGYQAQNSYLKHTLAYPDAWYRRPLALIVQRVVDLEQKNSPNLSKTISAVAAYTAGSFYRHKSGHVYNPVSAPLDSDKLWVKLLPYEVALGKNMLSFGYENYYYFDTKAPYFPKAFEIKPSFSMELYDKKNQVSFFRLDLNLNFELKQDILSIGFGPSLYRDFDNKLDREIDGGFNGYIDFLNMVRITATSRNDYQGQDWHIYVGINDIPSFVYWLFAN